MVHKVLSLSIITVALIKFGAIVISVGRSVLIPGEDTPPFNIKLSIPAINILQLMQSLLYFKRGYSIHNHDSMITIFLNISGIPQDRLILEFTVEAISVAGSFDGKSFCHNIPLPCKIDIYKISYIYNNGVLEINCPKQITDKKTIKVQ